MHFVQKYQKQIQLFVGGNLIVALNFAFNFVLRALVPNSEFNKYIALSSILLVFGFANRISENTFTLHGKQALYLLKEAKLKLVATVFLIAQVLLSFGLVYHNIQSDTLLAVSVSILVLFSFVNSIEIGILYGQEKFFYPLALQTTTTVLKLTLGLLIFAYYGLTIFVASLALLTIINSLVLYTNSKTNELSDTKKPLNLNNLLFTVFIFLTIELIVNIDGLLAQTRLSVEDAYIYNSINLLYKGIYFASLGFSTLFIARLRDSNKSYKSLLESLAASFVIGVFLVTGLILAQELVLGLLGFGGKDIGYEYTLILCSGVSTSILTLFATGVLGLQKFQSKVFSIMCLILFLCLYFVGFESIRSAAQIFFIGTIACTILLAGVQAWEYRRA